MAAVTRSPRRAGRVITVLVLAALPLVAWRLWSGHARGQPGSAAGDAVLQGQGTDDRGGGPRSDHNATLPEILRRARGNPGPLIEAYAAWAGDPAALADRRVVLGALAAQPQPAVRLAALLAAVQASPVAAADDPLQREAVAAVSSVWRGDMVRRGRDLIFTESRPKAREVVIASFVELALSDRGAELDAAQRYGLTSDFVDLYPRSSADRRHDIVAVVRKLGGNDAAELLGGNGLADDSQLQTKVRYQRELQAARARARGAEGQPPAGPRAGD